LFKENEDHSLYYCVSAKCNGEIGWGLKPEVFGDFKTSMLGWLHHIHQLDITETRKYGEWIEFSQAPHSTWNAFMQDYTRKKIDEAIIFLEDQEEEIAFIEKLAGAIEPLLDVLPENRGLIHGDYGANNIFANAEGEVTGIFDWELSKFGDFVYDLGWLDYWGMYEQISFSEDYLELCRKSRNLNTDNYEERVHCYKLAVGLHMAWFSSKIENKEWYRSGKKLILPLL
jgi:hygromycin-B 4-O-kinase